MIAMHSDHAPYIPLPCEPWVAPTKVHVEPRGLLARPFLLLAFVCKCDRATFGALTCDLRLNVAGRDVAGCASDGSVAGVITTKSRTSNREANLAWAVLCVC